MFVVKQVYSHLYNKPSKNYYFNKKIAYWLNYKKVHNLIIIGMAIQFQIENELCVLKAELS